MKWWERLRHWLTTYPLPEPPMQTTWCNCPVCGQDLVSMLDRHVFDSQKGVQYRCACGRWSSWDFDAPVPLLRRHAATEEELDRP